MGGRAVCARGYALVSKEFMDVSVCLWCEFYGFVLMLRSEFMCILGSILILIFFLN